MAAEGSLRVQGTLKLYSSLFPGAQRSALPKAAIEKWETIFWLAEGRPPFFLNPKWKDLMLLNSLNLSSLNCQNLIQMYFVKIQTSDVWLRSHIERKPLTGPSSQMKTENKERVWGVCGDLEEVPGILVTWFQIWFYHCSISGQEGVSY